MKWHFSLFHPAKTCFSPDEMTLRALPSGQSRDPPDGIPLRLAHQNHFGSQCAPQSVYWHLPAKVKLKKSHFGKPPLTECALRPPPSKVNWRSSHNILRTFREPAIHPEGNAIHGLVEGTISSEKEGPSEECLCCERQKPATKSKNTF